jgi:hypothetical protein
MNSPGIVRRIRSRLAELAFRLAGKLDKAYDVWLDDAPQRFALNRYLLFGDGQDPGLNTCVHDFMHTHGDEPRTYFSGRHPLESTAP